MSTFIDELRSKVTLKDYVRIIFKRKDLIVIRRLPESITMKFATVKLGMPTLSSKNSSHPLPARFPSLTSSTFAT